jgi:HD-like signal output (HDOD) protein
MAAERGCPVYEAEEELLGTSHAEIGAYLLGLWGLPNIAVEAIAHHHRPDRIPHSGFDCTVAVYVANVLDDELEAHPQDETGLKIEEPIRKRLEALGVLSRFAEFRELALEARR